MVWYGMLVGGPLQLQPLRWLIAAVSQAGGDVVAVVDQAMQQS